MNVDSPASPQQGHLIVSIVGGDFWFSELAEEDLMVGDTWTIEGIELRSGTVEGVDDVLAVEMVLGRDF